MPKATIAEQEVPAEPDDIPLPETPQEEEVSVPKPKTKEVSKPRAKAVPKKATTDLKAKHTCGRCGKTMSLYTTLYSHKCLARYRYHSHLHWPDK